MKRVPYLTIADSFLEQRIIFLFWKSDVRLSENEFLNFRFLAKNQ